MKRIIIFSDIVNNRLTYVLDVIFKHVLMVDYSILNKKEFTQIKDAVKINYSSEKIESTIQIIPHQIISENTIEKYVPKVVYQDGVPYFFKTSSVNEFQYDLFACVFFMVSRYEEYLNSDLDIHGRFKAENSLAFKHDFLEHPVVHYWVKKLQNSIETNHPNYQFPTKKYKYINSIDIDVAYSYKGKSKALLFISFFKNILQINTQEIKNKFSYFVKSSKDPFDTYEIFRDLSEKYKKPNLFFIQIGNYGTYDKNLHYKSSEFNKLIKRLQQKNTIGLHPSYHSNYNQESLGVEKERLEGILKENITKSRQHFLKLSFPKTYENLITQGIKDDYTLGFASRVGFRAGICNPYPFFNLKTNEQTSLILHPFQIMDGTLNSYMNLTPEQAIAKSKEIIKKTKAVEGTFISLWHNSSLSEQNEWKNWKSVYTELVQYAQEN